MFGSLVNLALQEGDLRLAPEMFFGQYVGRHRRYLLLGTFTASGAARGAFLDQLDQCTRLPLRP